MGRFQISGIWYDAPTYIAAQALHRAAQPGAHVAAPAPVAAPVVAVNPVLTPVANFAGRSTIRYGVGEKVRLSFTTVPPGRDAATFGGLQWALMTGHGVVQNDPGNVGTGMLTCGTDEGEVVLALKTAGAPAVNKAAKRLQVIRPSDIVFVRAPGTGVYHRTGTPGAGFEAVTYLRPTDVSFSNLQYREGGASYTGTGAYAITELTRAQLAQNYEVIHPIRADWQPVNGGDSIVNGSMVHGSDRIKSGPVPVLNVAGRFCWSIPQYGRVIGTRADFLIKSLDHVEVVDAAGTLTISKGGVSVTCHLNNPDSRI